MRPLAGEIEATLNQFTQFSILLPDDLPIYPDTSRNAVRMPWREIMERDKNKMFTLKPQKFKIHIKDTIRQTVDRSSD